ncbi:MAG: glutamine synthetase family protein [Christensenellales bacterium]|jgi:glutamine synthetase
MTDFITAAEVLESVEENDVKFIRLAFCDLFGMQKNWSVTRGQLHRVIEQGMLLEASSINGFSGLDTELLRLVPDPATLRAMPWRPQHGRVVRLYCDILSQDGSPFEGDSRHLLKQAVSRLQAQGLCVKAGMQCSFYLFMTDENGTPTLVPHDQGGYLDIAPLDKGENVRREICLALEEMGIEPVSSRHEQGPGQHEIHFVPSDPLRAADDFLTFKAVVKAIAARNGLHASFMPRPLEDAPQSTMRITLSLYKDGQNIASGQDKACAALWERFLAGNLEFAGEMTLLLNPTYSAYARFTGGAPYIKLMGEENTRRMALNCADPSLNPYLALALILEAGLSGVKEQLCLDTAGADSFTVSLPEDIAHALEAARGSAFVRDVLGKGVLAAYMISKKREWTEIQSAQQKVFLNHFYSL